MKRPEYEAPLAPWVRVARAIFLGGVGVGVLAYGLSRLSCAPEPHPPANLHYRIILGSPATVRLDRPSRQCVVVGPKGYTNPARLSYVLVDGGQLLVIVGLDPELTYDVVCR